MHTVGDALFSTVCVSNEKARPPHRQCSLRRKCQAKKAPNQKWPFIPFGYYGTLLLLTPTIVASHSNRPTSPGRENPGRYSQTHFRRWRILLTLNQPPHCPRSEYVTCVCCLGVLWIPVLVEKVGCVLSIFFYLSNLI